MLHLLVPSRNQQAILSAQIYNYLNLILLFAFRLRERDRIRRILLAGTDRKLLILGVDEDLDVRCVVKLGCSLVVELQNTACDGSNGSGTGLYEVDNGNGSAVSHTPARAYCRSCHDR